MVKYSKWWKDIVQESVLYVTLFFFNLAIDKQGSNSIL